jgi:hypothetical protein
MTACTNVLPTQVADFIMQTTLAELDDAAVQLDPLIKLPCSHVFSASKLDGE